MDQAKQRLRKSLSAKRKNLSENEMWAASERACRNLASLEYLQRPYRIAVYAAFGRELRLDSLIRSLEKQNREYLLPRFDRETGRYRLATLRSFENDTAKGHYGIAEPKEECELLSEASTKGREIIWLVPGVAFDPLGHRLGRGAGYYDRMLAGTKGRKVGVAYDWQIVERVPSGNTDIDMDCVVTDKRIFSCPPQPGSRSAETGI